MAALPDRNNGAEFRPNAHGGRNQRGAWARAKNIHCEQIRSSILFSIKITENFV